MDFELREARRAAHLTQLDLARVSGISLREIKALESCEVINPHPDTLRRLKLALRPTNPYLLSCRSTTGDDFSFLYPSEIAATTAAIEFLLACRETEFRHAGEEARLPVLLALLTSQQWLAAIRFINDWTDCSILVHAAPSLAVT